MVNFNPNSLGAINDRGYLNVRLDITEAEKLDDSAGNSKMRIALSNDKSKYIAVEHFDKVPSEEEIKIDARKSYLPLKISYKDDDGKVKETWIKVNKNSFIKRLGVNHIGAKDQEALQRFIQKKIFGEYQPEI